MSTNIRPATVADAAVITAQRHKMFADNNLATEARLLAMDANFEPWLRERLADGRYLGLLLELEGPELDAQVVAGGGIFLQDFPPHFLDIEPLRAYLLNFYTDPAVRGRGYAKQLVQAAVALCHDRNIAVISLHASPFGRPIYEQQGFTASNEMQHRPKS